MTETHKLIAYARFGFALACVAAPKAAAVSLGERSDEVNPTTASFAALVGTRAAALGVVGLSTPGLDPAHRRRAFLLLAAVDGFDTVNGYLRSRRVQRLAPIVVGVPFGVVFTAAELYAARAAR